MIVFMNNNTHDMHSASQIISRGIYSAFKDLLPVRQQVVHGTVGEKVMREMTTLLPWDSMVSPSLIRHYYDNREHFNLNPAQIAALCNALLYWIDHQQQMKELIHDSITYPIKLSHIQKLRMFTCIETAFIGAYLMRREGYDAYVMSAGTYDRQAQVYTDYHSMTFYSTQKDKTLSQMISDLTSEDVRIFDYWLGIDGNASEVLSKADSFFLLDRKNVKTCCTIPAHPTDGQGNLLEPKPKDYLMWKKRFYLSQYNVQGFECMHDKEDAFIEHLPPISKRDYRAKVIGHPSKLKSFWLRYKEALKSR